MPEDLKTVATFATPIEADMAKNCLEAAGIKAFLADEQTVGWLWHLGSALRGIKLQVAESHLPQAVEILEAARSEAGEEATPDADQAPRFWVCSNCASRVDVGMDVCWACGATADGQEDLEFQRADEPMTPRAKDDDEVRKAPGPWLAFSVAFVVPLVILNVLVGIDVFLGYASKSTLAPLMLLLFGGELLAVIVIFNGLYYRPKQEEPDEVYDGVGAAADGLGTLPDAAEMLEGDWDLETAARYAIARRACVAAVLGVAFCPPLLNVYSLWLIVKSRLYRAPLHGKPKLFLYSAIVLNVIVCLVALLLFTVMVGLGG